MAGDTDLLSVDLDAIGSLDELKAHGSALRAEMQTINTEHGLKPMGPDVRDRFAELTKRNKEVTARGREFAAREATLRAAFEDEDRQERIGQADEMLRSIPKPTPKERDVYDLSDPRIFTERGALRDQALRSLDLADIRPSDGFTSEEDAKAHVDQLVRSIDMADLPMPYNPAAMYLLTTGAPDYRSAFGKAVIARALDRPLSLSAAEQAAWQQADRALSLTGASGGFAVPYVLDPTVLGTSNYAVNPFRAIARVEQIDRDEWRGVTSGAITAAYAAEATETTDNAPTLAQPTISTEKAQAFVPFSIEIGMDWTRLEEALGGLLQEAKDELEATKFVSGSGTDEPFGVITGATNTVNATTGQTFDAEDLYRLEGTLPPRYRPRASIVGNRSIFNLVRQFDTQGGAQLWVRIGDGLPNRPDGRLGVGLLGYPTYEASAMASSAATSNKFLLIGDFSRYVIADRIGLQIDVIPHLFGTNHRPTGQRGLYAFWRNGAKVIDANAFRVLLGVA